MKGKLFAVALGLVLVAPACRAADRAKVGDKVWAQWKPNAWYPGKATKAVPTGLHVLFDDGDEADVALPLVAVDRAPKAEEVKVGSRVLSLRADNRFYPGTITKIDGGTYSVGFDDKDTRDVAVSDLRLLPVRPAPAKTAKAGDKVWAQWKPNAWYPGKAAKAVPTGLHVVFDDGDEADLPVELIAVDRAPKPAGVKVGTHVLGLWTDNRFYPGVVSKIDGDTYSIQFEDGDTRDVAVGDIRLVND
jgi:hypothetical protein